MAGPDVDGKLSGVVEVDETYVGGRPRNAQKKKTDGSKYRTGRGTRKTPVLALVERNGGVRTRVLPNVTAKTLKSAILDNVDTSARLMTDEFCAYTRIGLPFRGGHDVVKHSQKEYARGDVTTNTVEAFFALLKRGIYGTFHAVSKEHLHRYLAEFEFRWATRKIEDGERISKAIRNSEGKRLMYREPVAKSA